MTDIPHQTIIPQHTENGVSLAIRHLVVPACFELLFGVVLYFFAYLILNKLQIDALPPFTISNVPIIQGIAIGFMVVSSFHFIYLSLLNRFYKNKSFLFIGYILGCIAVPFIPTGAFFGILFITDLNTIRVAKDPKAVEILAYNKNEVGIEIKTNALVMLHLPVVLYYLYLYLLTIQSDILYPNFRMGVILSLKIFMYAYFVIYTLQFVAGIIFRFYGEKLWEQIVLIVFSIFNLLAVGIVIQTYVWLNWATLEFSGIMLVVGNLFWVIGIVINPIGIFFSRHFIKLLRQMGSNLN
ncbi:MAG: hypothetical protein JW776_12610 [Candidatus Lokiarchaeota archaeon]|nr:hypothetical protein [Candidatus Lokiarchaeota archaeon]